VVENKGEPAEGILTAGKEAAPGQSLGHSLIDARKKKGLSTEDVVRQTHIPAHYVRMIESDDYGLISDQLYVLPFLRRYAAFVGLDQEEIATRFVREVQRADSYAAKMAEPIPVPEPVTRRPRLVPIVVAAIAVAVVVVAYVTAANWRRRQGAAVPAALPSVAASTSASPAPASLAPAPASAPSSSQPQSAASANDADPD
jgi:cytoskeleton protein RodZ